MYIRTFACTMKNKNFILIHKKQTSLITVKLNENCRNVKKNLKKKIKKKNLLQLKVIII